MDQIDEQFTQLSASDEKVKRLMQIPGYEPVVSSALVSVLGDGSQLKRWRVASVWLGLVPKLFGSDGKTVMLGISKHCNRYLRTLLIRGARAVLAKVHRRDDALS